MAIKFTQGATTDDFGKAVLGVLTTNVVCTSDVSGSTYSWTLEAVPTNPGDASYNSALVAGTVISTSTTANFSPDANGEFQIGLVVDSNPKVTNCFAVPDAEGLIDPSYQATPDNTKYGTNTRGWSFHLTRIFNAIRNRVSESRQILAGAGITVNGGASADLTADVTIASTGSGGHDILENGVAQTTRSALNFLADFSLTDDAGNDETEIALADILAEQTFQSSAGATAPVTVDADVAAAAGVMLFDMQRQGASKWWAYLDAAEELVFESQASGTAFWATTGFGIGPAVFTPAAALHARTSAAAVAADPAGIFDKNIAAAADNYLLSLRRQNTEYFGIKLDASNNPTIVASTLAISGTLSGYVPNTRRVIAGTGISVAGGGGGSNDNLTSDVTITATSSYRTLLANGTPVTQRLSANFSSEFSVADDAGNTETDIGLASTLSPHTFTSGTASTYPVVVDKTGSAAANNKLFQGSRASSEFFNIELDASDNAWVNSGAAKVLVLGVAGSGKITVASTSVTLSANTSISANFTPNTNNTRDLGASSLAWANLYVVNARFPAAGSWQTTVGSAGGASAPPATPTKYLKVVDDAGTTLVIPAYAAA